MYSALTGYLLINSSRTRTKSVSIGCRASSRVLQSNKNVEAFHRLLYITDTLGSLHFD